MTFCIIPCHNIMSMFRKVVGFSFIIIGLSLAVYVWYVNSVYHAQTRIFSTYAVLSSSWEKYKLQFLNKDGRIIDYSQNSITTSEGQSYALLRSVWIDDKPTFDLVWKWTQENLQKRPNDNLLGWRWGKNTDGTYGFITGGGDVTATDADEDTALALIFASYRWGDSHYLGYAQGILTDLYKYDTDIVQGNRYLLPGEWASRHDNIVINPSYFAPYAWKIFATVDSKDDWNSLIDPSYTLLNDSGKQSINGLKGVGIAPDWIVLNRDGTFQGPYDRGMTDNNSFDAMRTSWRIALDYQWNKDDRAKNYVTSSCEFFKNKYLTTGKLATTYAYDGSVLDGNENPTRYSTVLGCFIGTDKALADDIYQNKILRLYSNSDSSFNNKLPYYDANFLWFGVAFYDDFLIPYKK